MHGDGNVMGPERGGGKSQRGKGEVMWIVG